ncbi:hypothetical protein POREN0001_1830 [Porphyromonas endodontalis ATCC 35406]|uniref:Uncharacterized protein n=1 Tax=Porphyromonas endodontalis (strain ATCC 35406 / DSM 24491 / JCM 8526 / CCUG 16442 / BCRC 14492 / NCTC 13058 / HG 370) TaxID=553175 RepID=C3JBU4_POREA|nr:hypothetical protein POREN0001_1830 [Porphyromonas endodontalis ATCC 35406]
MSILKPIGYQLKSYCQGPLLSPPTLKRRDVQDVKGSRLYSSFSERLNVGNISTGYLLSNPWFYFLPTSITWC